MNIEIDISKVIDNLNLAQAEKMLELVKFRIGQLEGQFPELTEEEKAAAKESVFNAIKMLYHRTNCGLLVAKRTIDNYRMKEKIA